MYIIGYSVQFQWRTSAKHLETYVRRVSSIRCHIGGPISHNSWVVFSLFLINFSCFLIHCLVFEKYFLLSKCFLIFMVLKTDRISMFIWIYSKTCPLYLFKWNCAKRLYMNVCRKEILQNSQTEVSTFSFLTFHFSDLVAFLFVLLF